MRLYVEKQETLVRGIRCEVDAPDDLIEQEKRTMTGPSPVGVVLADATDQGRLENVKFSEPVLLKSEIRVFPNANYDDDEVIKTWEFDGERGRAR